MLGRGYKGPVYERIIEKLQKKVVKNFLRYEIKISRGAVNLRSIPGRQTP